MKETKDGTGATILTASTTDYYQVEPVPAQPDSVTTYTKRTPQKFRICWNMVKGDVKGRRIGFPLFGRRYISLDYLEGYMDSIEKQVRSQ